MIALPPPPADLLTGAALFLDFDGTLVAIAERPDAIHVPDGLGILLADLHRMLGGRLAIVSGRAIDDLDRHLDCTGVDVVGSHGGEARLAGGERLAVAAPPGLEELREAADALAAARPGVLVEHKPTGIALHYRAAPDAAGAILAFAEEAARAHGLAVQRGKCVVEVRPADADKGRALRDLMARPPFAGAHPVFVGDDLTDEHAFNAAALLGGGGVLVGPPRETAARWRLNDVEEVAWWLKQARG